MVLAHGVQAETGVGCGQEPAPDAVYEGHLRPVGRVGRREDAAAAEGVSAGADAHVGVPGGRAGRAIGHADGGGVLGGHACVARRTAVLADGLGILGYGIGLDRVLHRLPAAAADDTAVSLEGHALGRLIGRRRVHCGYQQA